MSAALVAGLAAGYGVAIPVGAIAPLLMNISARSGLRVGAAAAAGVASADGLYAAAAPTRRPDRAEMFMRRGAMAPTGIATP